MGERTRLLTLLTAALVVAAGALPGAAAAQGGVPSGLPGDLRGAARRPDRERQLPGGRVRGHVARLVGAQLRRGDRPVPPVPRGLGRPPAATLGPGRPTRTFTRGIRRLGRLQRRAGDQRRRRRRRRPPSARRRLPGHLPGAPQRPHRQLRRADGQLHDHAARRRTAALRAGLARISARFLQDFDGILPRPWFLDRETGTFMRGRRNVGFRVKEDVLPRTPTGTAAAPIRPAPAARAPSGSSTTTDRLPAAPERPVHDHAPASGQAVLRPRIRVLPQLPAGLRRRAAAPVGAESADGDIHARSGSDTGFRVKPAR